MSREDEEFEDSNDSADDDFAVRDCPYCGREIAEDSPQCPKCRNYITDEETHTRTLPRWSLITAVVVLVVFVLGIVLQR